MLERLQHFFLKRISPNGLSVFRIVYSFIYLLEVITIFNYRQLYYDVLPFWNPHFPDSGMLFVLWMADILSLIFGFHARIAAIINYIFTSLVIVFLFLVIFEILF